VPLGEVAEVAIVPAPNTIKRESASRRIDVTCNVRGRDLGRVAREIESRVRQVDFDRGYHPEFLGEYAAQQASRRRITLMGAVALAGIVVLLYSEFRAWRLVMLVMLSLLFALIGGVVAVVGRLAVHQTIPRHMFDRHGFTTAPICVNGRMFTLGERVLFANDAYNGAELWFEELPELPLRVNIARDCGFLTADQEHVFVGAGDNCVCLDANTGERVQPYPLPPHSEKKYKYDWGYVGIDGELLFGSGVRKGSFYCWGRGPWYDKNKEKVNSDFLFALGKEDRQLRWKYDGVVINSTITVGGGRVYFLGQRDPRRLALESRLLDEWNDMAIVALDQ